MNYTISRDWHPFYRYLDFMNLMTYDLRGEADQIASHHSALYFGSYEEGDQKVYNQVCYF